MNYLTVNDNELKLFIPSGIVISGPSSSGKTQLVLKLLKHAEEIFYPPPKAISKSFLHFVLCSIKYGDMVNIRN